MKKLKPTLLIIVIYISFISLGLPDTVLGVAWPSIRSTFKLPLQVAGVITVVTTIGTAISCFASGIILRKIKTGQVVFISSVLTGTALLGYSIAPAFSWLLLLTIPLGIGAGAVDTGINNYVALNYSQRDMNWLHCFWGIGAFVGPNIINFSVMYSNGWRGGYRMIGIIQICIAAIILISLPLWRKKSELSKTDDRNDSQHKEKLKAFQLFTKKGVVLSILAFPMYIAVEMGTGVWLASYLIESRDINKIRAGILVSIFYASITIGRLLSGIIATRYSNNELIKKGLGIMLIAAILLNIPNPIFIIPAIILLGVGCAPIYPSMLHNTPKLFGIQHSQEITGYQIGSSYLSGVIIVPLIGFLADKITIEIIPLSILLFTISIIIIMRKLNTKDLSNSENLKQESCIIRE